jgi:hypothetical protein
VKGALLAAAASLSLGAFATTLAVADDASAQLKSAYEAQCKAFVATDAKSFAKTFDPSYISTDLDGKQQTLTEVVADAMAPQAGVTITACSVAIRKLTPAAGSATVLATLTAGGTLTRDGSALPFTQEQESTDTWTLAATPLETTSVETGSRTTIGGKVVEEKGKMTTPATSGR